jgi:hypothetical protein
MAHSYTPAYGALFGCLPLRQLALTTEVSDADIARMIAGVPLIELEAIVTGESGT